MRILMVFNSASTYLDDMRKIQHVSEPIRPLCPPEAEIPTLMDKHLCYMVTGVGFAIGFLHLTAPLAQSISKILRVLLCCSDGC
jgi:hypothetical protein